MIARAARRSGTRDAPADAWLADVVRRAWKMKIFPHVQVEIEGQLRERGRARGDPRSSPRTCATCCWRAPAGARVAMGLDPGLRTGVKAAVVDATGALLETATVFPHQPRNEWEPAIEALAELIATHGVELVAIGNGTGVARDRPAGVRPREAPPRAEVPQGHRLGGRRVGRIRASKLAARELGDLDVPLRGGRVDRAPAAGSAGRAGEDRAPLDRRRAVPARRQPGPPVARARRRRRGLRQRRRRRASTRRRSALLRRVAGLNHRLADNVVAYPDDASARSRDRQRAAARSGLRRSAFEQAAGSCASRTAPTRSTRRPSTPRPTRSSSGSARVGRPPGVET